MFFEEVSPYARKLIVAAVVMIQIEVNRLTRAGLNHTANKKGKKVSRELITGVRVT